MESYNYSCKQESKNLSKEGFLFVVACFLRQGFLCVALAMVKLTL